MQDTGISIEEKGGRAQITFSGKINVDNIESMLPEINAAIDKFGSFVFKIREIESLDLAGMQMLISIKKTLDKTRKSAEFDFNLPDNIRESVSEAGLLYTFD